MNVGREYIREDIIIRMLVGNGLFIIQYKYFTKGFTESFISSMAYDDYFEACRHFDRLLDGH